MANQPQLLGNYLGTNINQAVTPNLTGNLQTDQNAANQANTGRFNQGLQNLIQGYNSGGQTISQAMAASQQYGQTAQNKLNLQYQNALGSMAQNSTSRGLGNTTIADTMKDLPTRQYNDASLQNTEMVANRQTGLLMQQAQNQQQGANNISGYIASKNDVAPNAEMYTQLQKQAASNPGMRNVSAGAGGGGSFGSPSDFMRGQGQSGNPNTSNGGGASSASGSNPGQLYYNGLPGNNSSSISGAMGGGGGQGYQGGTLGGTGMPGANDGYSSATQQQTGVGQGGISIANSMGQKMTSGNVGQPSPAPAMTSTPTQAPTPNAVQQNATPQGKVQISRAQASYNGMVFGSDWANQYGGMQNVQIV